MSELSNIPGLEKGIIGVAVKHGQSSLCYSVKKCVEILSEESNMSIEQAKLFLQQAESMWAGASSPTFLYPDKS